MKVIGINTSPRENSNVKIAIEKALEAAASKGAETEIFNTNKMNISPCQACNYCKANEAKCIVDDEMQTIYRAIEEADAVILGAPIYFFDVSAQAKIFIDRMYAYFQFPFAETYGNKKFSFIVSQGTPDADAFKDVINTQANAFGFLGFEVKDVAILVGNNAPGAIEENEEQIKQAVAVGENIVE